MKKSKLTEMQIIAMLNEGIAGVLGSALCRKYVASKATYYKVKSKYVGV